MEPIDKDECGWGSRHVYLKVLLCQTIGTNAFVLLPNLAITHGASGYIIGYVIAYVVVGIPLLYMEFIVSQFTARDCIQVWKVRACLSHVGYVHIFWQLLMVINNHAMTAFIIHYFLISFEDPIPYYVCGSWSKDNCNIIAFNYTVNQDCIKLQEPYSYCKDLYKTFPECQYWKNYILGTKAQNFHVAWRVCLASGLGCTILFLSCFKKKQSVKWCVGVFTMYPILGYTVLMIASMAQKGLVVMYEDAIDADFTVFSVNYRVSNIILHVLYSLNIGTGISFNLAASTSFRSPCYSNTVLTVIICAAVTVLSVSTCTMMACPYAYEYGIKPYSILRFPISLVFEKIPRLIYEYEYKTIWLILIFSCHAIVAISTNVIVVLNWLDMIGRRHAKVDKYPGLVTFVFICILFFITIPLLGVTGLYLLVDIRRLFNFSAVFIAILECLVFVLWYGLEKFSEDVHFMQGIQPKRYMKTAWVILCGVLGYVFCEELYNQIMTNTSFGEKLGAWILAGTLGGTILIAIIKLVVAACRKKFQEAICLDPSWGPRTDVLLRSRAMFTAQAMTKEYLYRQYHLQAGILARQQRSNVRIHRDV